jgi:hypothetical protein
MITLMAALLLLGFVATGCGGDDEGSGDSGDTAAQTVTDVDTETEVDTVTDDEIVTDTETVTDETATDETGTGTATSDGGGAAAPNVARAVASCKQAVSGYPQLSADTKSNLEDLCEKASSGNAEDAREAGREVCRQVVEDVYPSGVPGKDKALASCEKNVK